MDSTKPAEAASAADAAPKARARAAASKYRPDIDGLRAIAICLVVVFHLFKSALPSGFVGVDVFFVISGYVVTSSLARETSQSALSETLAFWRRRIARIYPALTICILVTLSATLIFLPPFPRESYDATIRTGLSALFGLGNLYLFKSQQDYFTSDLSKDPFVHTWSLGVEEQFYFLFSITFIVLPLLWGRIRPGPVRLAVVGALTAASAALMLRSTNASAIYYLFQFRFWELGIGSLLAQLPSPRLPRAAREAASGIGLAAILGVAAAQPTESPVLAIAIASAAAGLLIWVNADVEDPSSIAFALAFEPVRRVGLLSYSLYLWHWPTIILFGLTVGLDGPLEIAAAVAAFSALAATSYFLIERPLRSKKISFSKRVLPAVAGLSAAAIAIGVTAQRHPGFAFAGRPLAWAGEWLPGEDFAYAKEGLIRAKSCNRTDEAPVQVPIACETAGYRAPNRAPAILSLGDSLSYADWGMLSAGSERGHFEWAALSRDGCSIEAENTPPSCQRYWDTMPVRIAGAVRPNDFVLVATLWSLHAGADYSRAASELAKLATVVEARGARLIVQAPTPQFAKDAFVCTPEWFRKDYDGCTLARAKLDTERAAVMAILADLRRRHPRVMVWDPAGLLCAGGTCRQLDGEGRPVFRNWDHLAFRGSRSLGQAFTNFLKQAAVSAGGRAAPANGSG
jgi:peptidoglycan/LPS O-acetylase OafA/YrhL